VRQTARATDAADDGHILRGYANLGHSLMQGSQEEVVATTRTPPGLAFLEITCTVTHILYFYYKDYKI
jgi:hypothetical protein